MVSLVSVNPVPLRRNSPPPGLARRPRLYPARHYAASECIFLQGDAYEKLYIVDSGCVRVSRMSADGRRQIIAFHFPGEIFGFEAQAQRQTSAEAVEPSGVRALRDSGDRFAPGVLELLYDYMDRAEGLMMMLGTQNSLERLASFLVDVSIRQSHARHLRLPMGRSDIADHLGLKLETVSRAMHRLQEDGFIRLLNPKNIEIVDQAGLAEIGNPE